MTASNNSTIPLFESVHPTTQRDLVSRFLCSAVTTYRVSTIQTSGCRARPRPHFEVRKSGNNALLSPQCLGQAVAHISLDLLSHISPTDCFRKCSYLSICMLTHWSAKESSRFVALSIFDESAAVPACCCMFGGMWQSTRALLHWRVCVFCDLGTVVKFQKRRNVSAAVYCDHAFQTCELSKWKAALLFRLQ